MPFARLTVQYRMHPALAQFSSDQFYDGKIVNGVTAKERISEFPFPKSSVPLFFLDVPGKESAGKAGVSYSNKSELESVESVVEMLLLAGIPELEIGVITPYKLQKKVLTKNLDMPGIDINSVDAFQGREKDFIIVSTVRANNEAKIGFLDDPRRMNVMLTRARRGLIVVGCAHTLASGSQSGGIWNEFLQYMDKLQVVFTGSLDSLRKVVFTKDEDCFFTGVYGRNS